MEVLGVGPHETWIVGDNLEWEIVAPQRLGIYAIWYDGYGVGRPRNSAIRPDCIIRRLSELLLYPSLWRPRTPSAGRYVEATNACRHRD